MESMEGKTFDKLVHYPPEEEAILKWWENCYEAAYVAFHPFFRIEGWLPKDYEHGTKIIDARSSAVSTEQLFEELNSTKSEGERQRHEQFYDDWRLRAKTVSWRDVATRSGIRSETDLNVALLTNILALGEQYSNEIDAKKLADWCTENDVFMPTEGEVQPTLVKAMGDLFQKLGRDEIWLGDEFDDNRTTVSVSDFLLDKFGPDFFVRNIFDGSNQALVTVHWDSFFTLFCGPRLIIEEVVQQNGLEGFFCDEYTSHDWWSHKE